MGLLDNNKVLTTPKTGLEGSPFNLLVSNDKVDVWEWKGAPKILYVTFRDIYVWGSGNKVYLVKGKITDEPIVVSVNATNFPGLRIINNVLPTIEKIIACPTTFTYSNGSKYGHVSAITGLDCRICVIFNNGQIFHNYPSCQDDCDFYNKTWAVLDTVKVEDMFSKFSESVAWDLPDRKHPVKTKTGTDATLLATGVYYYNPSLPDNCYEMHPALNADNGYGNTVGFAATNNVNNISNGENIGLRPRFWRPNMDNPNCNSFCYMGGYVADNLFTMIGTYRSNVGNNPCRICVFGSQDGGRSWYNMYEFGDTGRNKQGEIYRATNGTIGITISQEGNASSGLYNVKRRTIVVPSVSDKEPSTLFEYDNALNISFIVGTSSAITVTTASAHGLSNGDTIVIGLQDGVSLNDRTFDWMVNSGANETSGGNGILFKVKNVTSTTFELTMYIWNPHTNLPIRHIHALNKCKDGVSVSCGEGYPQGWILYCAITAADAYAEYNVAKMSMNVFVRLTSTKDSLQRPLGTIVQQEGKETYCYVASDNEYTEMNEVEMPEGRTQSFKHNSCGIWKVKVSEIDSHKDNALLVYNARQTAFGFQQMGKAFVYTGQFGALAISFDNGVSWTVVQLPPEHNGQGLANFSGLTFDNKFSINNVLVQLKE